MTPEYIRRLKWKDRVARWAITSVGIGVIFCVIAILLLITKVAIPLFLPPSSHKTVSFPVPSPDSVVSIGSDEYMETGFTLTQQGTFHFYDLKTGSSLHSLVSHPPPGEDSIIEFERSGSKYSLLWNKGTTTLENLEFISRFEGSRRITEPKWTRLRTIPLQNIPFQNIASGSTVPLKSFIRLSTDPTRFTHVVLTAANQLKVTQLMETEDFLGEMTSESFQNFLNYPTSEKISTVVLDTEGYHLYAGTESGHLLHWDLSEPGNSVFDKPWVAFSDGRRVSALALVLGDRSLAVGDERGEIHIWTEVFENETDSSSRKWAEIHHFQSHHDKIIQIQSSSKDRSLASLSQSGMIHLDGVTSERSLVRLPSESPILQMTFSPRSDGILTFSADQKFTSYSLNIPHPEISWRSLFGKVWYENATQPEYVWQSSSGSDDFEPKLSLMPLLFGSIKGTLYGMLFAVPLALFAAIYLSQFTKSSIRNWVKPVVEIMAAVPSVVIGFLVALWLAPFLARYLFSFFLFVALLPIFIFLFMGGWSLLWRLPAIRKLPRGLESVLSLPVLLTTAVAAFLVAPPLENWIFQGSIQQWLFEEAGVYYDQRNSIVIAFGLGFLVIPLIFTIAEDALSNVPNSLKAASLALGASRWQTVWRVVIPSASPGIFAAIIIGFGRSIGETMVVLMATGNTPILDWSAFNGMRTLSANIAVELPEAPIDSSLYRVLFLSAVLLFLITSSLNTLAEIIRQRLRKRYGQH